MNKKSVSALVGLILLIAVAVPLSAESIHTMTVVVPFEFSAGNQLLPAGLYTVKVSVDSGMVTLGPEGHASRILMTIPKEALNGDGRGKLVFHRRSGNYFLAEVWSQGLTTGNTLPLSAREKEVARNQQSEQILAAQTR